MKDTAFAFWQQHREKILKGALIVCLIPLLIPIGILLFSVTSFILSIVLFLIVALFVIGLGLLAWSLIDEKLGQRKPRQDENLTFKTTRSSRKTKAAVIIDGEAREVNNDDKPAS